VAEIGGFVILMNGTQRQHWSQIFFPTFFSENPKIAKNSTTTKAREKSKHRFGILRIVEIF
jgi:hypothetical protein